MIEDLDPFHGKVSNLDLIFVFLMLVFRYLEAIRAANRPCHSIFFSLSRHYFLCWPHYEVWALLTYSGSEFLVSGSKK